VSGLALDVCALYAIDASVVIATLLVAVPHSFYRRQTAVMAIVALPILLKFAVVDALVAQNILTLVFTAAVGTYIVVTRKARHPLFILILAQPSALITLVFISWFNLGVPFLIPPHLVTLITLDDTFLGHAQFSLQDV
jgi:hypothetical protein